MGSFYDKQQRKGIINRLRGKRVEDIEYVEDGDQWCWVATLADGGEFSFRFMAEVLSMIDDIG
jgi:hypothetical protein